MKKSFYKDFILFLLIYAGVVSAISLPCFSENLSISVKQQPNASVGPEMTKDHIIEQKFKQMQEQLDTYKHTMFQMQNTLNLLKMQINKNVVEVQPDLIADPMTEKISRESMPMVLLNQDDIGENLIFGPVFSVKESAQHSSDSEEKKTFGSKVIQNFNPDMFVNGDFIGHYADRTDLPDRNRFILREAEIGFSASIDPYARGTFILALPNEEEVGIEEGYITLTALPGGLLGKLGKFRSSFGKINILHTHDLPQADRPAVYTHFFGDEGLSETGISLNKLLPTPWYSSLNLEMTNGDTAPLFGHGRMTRPLLVGHLKNFFEISDTTSLEVGISGAFGSKDIDHVGHITGVEGIDLTFRWLPPEQNHGFTWQSELLIAQQEDPVAGKSNLLGGYSFMEYKINNRWSSGVRVDYSQVPLVGLASEIAVAPYIDYWQSEFARLRLEYKHTFGHNMPSHNRLWAQYSVILGLHPPHAY